MTHPVQPTNTLLLPCLHETVYGSAEACLRVEHLRLQAHLRKVERMLKDLRGHTSNLADFIISLFASYQAVATPDTTKDNILDRAYGDRGRRALVRVQSVWRSLHLASNAASEAKRVRKRGQEETVEEERQGAKRPAALASTCREDGCSERGT